MQLWKEELVTNVMVSESDLKSSRLCEKTLKDPERLVPKKKLLMEHPEDKAICAGSTGSSPVADLLLGSHCSD